jgi:methionyl-tRNA synthetase
MIREVPIGEDGTFTPSQFVNRINMDLVNSYGNLLNRTISMIDKYLGGIVPEYQEPSSALVKKAYSDVTLYINQYEAQMDAFDVTKGADTAITLINIGNKLIEDEAPWTLAKDPSKAGELKETMYVLAEILRIGSILLRPFLVLKSDEALDQLNVPKEDRTYQSIRVIGKLSGVKLNEAKPLFPRLDKDKEMEYLANLIDVHTGEHA